MKISNVAWLEKRLGFIRVLGEKTARQRQIIDLIDRKETLTESEKKLLHVLATAEKNQIQRQEAQQQQAIQHRMAQRKSRRKRNHKMFIAAGIMSETGLIDKITGELNYDRYTLLKEFRELKMKLDTNP
ncbi:hypothetical protein [Arsenophonus nasoniae]|uniref:Uncharacterized protein n=1 Tax=Arsenophonus nasoniae TaxID=638 RepID=A0AA95GBW7_9GAMM|nr:hypothetical protein [Arsenophonus nasoniae]WGL94104.1 hypothetical protein QE207_01920 [Arsenophonus nasoniae]